MTAHLPHDFGATPRAASLGGLPCRYCGREADAIFDDGECPVRLRAALDAEVAQARAEERAAIVADRAACDDGV